MYVFVFIFISKIKSYKKILRPYVMYIIAHNHPLLADLNGRTLG